MNLFHGFTLRMYVCAYINTNIKQKRKRKGKTNNTKETLHSIPAILPL